MPRESLLQSSLEYEIFHVFIRHARLHNGPHLKEFLGGLERTILCRLLLRFNGNQRKTAQYLGIKYTTFHAKVKKHNIQFRKRPVRISSRLKLDASPNP